MNNNFRITGLVALVLTFFISCGQSQPEINKLNVNDFKTRLEAAGNPQILDVRTPGEFNGGHIKNAQNIDYNSPDFNQKLKLFKTEDTLFVYCLSGGRSSAAVGILKQMGFKHVNELQGGLMQWKQLDYPLEMGNAPIPVAGLKNLSAMSYDSIANSADLVVVDFFTTWCGPCKLMAPWLKRWHETYPDSVVKIVKIDCEQNLQLQSQQGITAYPTVKIYSKGKLVYDEAGMLTEEQLKALLKPYTTKL
ncbi:MAG: thioredoxin fold domain-containing protein [Flavobacteriales bacterium]|nr:thioredoxin fold domain-containing protein [Flavobacteriales bacterium]